MKFLAALGLRSRNHSTEQADSARDRALESVNGDPRLIRALGVLASEYEAEALKKAYINAHMQGVQDGTVIELFPSTELDLVIDDDIPHSIHFRNIKVIQNEVEPLVLFDQDEDIS